MLVASLSIYRDAALHLINSTPAQNIRLQLAKPRAHLPLLAPALSILLRKRAFSNIFFLCLRHNCCQQNKVASPRRHSLSPLSCRPFLLLHISIDSAFTFSSNFFFVVVLLSSSCQLRFGSTNYISLAQIMAVRGAEEAYITVCYWSIRTLQRPK